MSAGLLTLALLLDAVLGEPRALWSRLPHPAALMGRAVAFTERRLNHGSGRIVRGGLAIALLCLAMAALGFFLESLPFGWLISLILAAILIAQRALTEHLEAVAVGLETSLVAGRRAVAMIVGRDTDAMEDNAIIRSAIESGAENFSDGIIAPAFWYLVAGLPGLLVYKMVNTADSMIGYRTTQFEQFGKCAARLDDVLNLVPARLTACLYAMAHGSTRALSLARREARLHRSPNAGWPESAMASLLGIALSGPRIYHGKASDDAYVNAAARHDLIPNDIRAAIRINWRTWAIFTMMVAILALFQRLCT